MAEVIFIYNGLSITIQCQKDENLKDICQRFEDKVNEELSKIYFIYGGKIIHINQTFNNIYKEYNKDVNIIKILVYSFENNNSNDNEKEKSQDIICPKCENNCLINISEYKINISGCKYYHNTNNISLREFINNQKIDS